METDLEKLLKQTAAGNQQSFKALYELISPKVLAFLTHMLGDRHFAEDALQDAMVQVWNNASTYDESKAKASTWIVGIARNRALDQLRKSGRLKEVLRDGEYSIGEALYRKNTDASDEPVSDVTSGRLVLCMDELGDDPAACIKLAYMNGFTFQEIATAQMQSIGTVKSWVRRGLQKLRECMHR
ncbi:RNA polymerase sigma factor [Litorivivens sp.]|uniref:RNA polymerase sigma factor n=1 Tax=Litorivivens sp. TaxID=2020868 RepID=UPI0035697D99